MSASNLLLSKQLTLNGFYSSDNHHVSHNSNINIVDKQDLHFDHDGKQGTS